MRILFKHIFIAFLILLTAGAVFFCTLTPILSMSHETHGAPMNHTDLTSHFIYAKELTGIISTTSLLSMAILSLMIISLIFFSYQKLYSFLQPKLSFYLKRKDQRYLFVAQSAITHWLSLFELSPNFIKPA